MMTKSFMKWLLVFLVNLLFVYLFHRLISQKIEFVVYSNDNLIIQDYAYHIIITKAFWFDGFGDIYKLTFQQQALSAYIGSPINKVMPIGITPIALVVWFPFAYVARINMALSYTIWIAFSIDVLFTALWQIGRHAFKNRKLQLLPITLSFVVIFSTTSFYAIYIGQTSLLAAGLVLHLLFFASIKSDQLKPENLVLIILISFVLGIKPPYFALGLALLITYGMWLEAFYSVAFAIIILIALTPMLSINWIHSYLILLQMYSQGSIPHVYAWSIVPHTMNIFRSAFRKLIGDDISSLISNVVTYCVYLGVVGFCLFSKIRCRITDQLSALKVTKAQLIVIIIANYLLFAPYVNGYEDLLIISVFGLGFFYGNFPPLTNYNSLALIIICFLVIHHNCFPPDKPLWLFWIFKVVILGYMFRFYRFHKKEEYILLDE